MHYFKFVAVGHGPVFPGRPRHDLAIVLDRYPSGVQAKFLDDNIQGDRGGKRVEASRLTVDLQQQRHGIRLSGLPAEGWETNLTRSAFLSNQLLIK